MNIAEYTELKNNVVKSLGDIEIIRNHSLKIEYYNNDHATVDISVKGHNQGWYMNFMERMKEQNKDIVEYVTFRKSDGSCSSMITIKFFDDKKVCKE